ncbi:MAG: AAA family ATPase [Pseudomonadota bacterium]
MTTAVPVLIVMAGLPGTGKTTLAKVLAVRLQACYLRIDTIEQALMRSTPAIDQVSDAGYLAAYALAADNLRPGSVVIADSVNPITLTREDWQAVGDRAGARTLNLALICSDKAQHRARVERRVADIPGHQMPSWQDVENREYEPWTKDALNADHLVLDTTTMTTQACCDAVMAWLEE